MLDSVSEERAHHDEGGHPMGWPPSFTTTEQTRTGTPAEVDDSDKTNLVVMQLLFWGLLGLTGLLGLRREPSRFAAPFVFVTPR